MTEVFFCILDEEGFKLFQRAQHRLKKKNKIRNEKNDANPWLNKISVEYSIDKIDVLTAGYFYHGNFSAESIVSA